METPKKPPPKQPTFVEGLIGAAIPLAAAIVIASIAGLLVYLFWFGFEGLSDRLFHR
jgi:hypothetical protein